MGDPFGAKQVGSVLALVPGNGAVIEGLVFFFQGPKIGVDCQYIGEVVEIKRTCAGE